MTPITIIYRLSLALLLAASVTACGTDSSSSGGSSDNGGDGLSLRVTDAPTIFTDIERLDITFREVHLIKADGGKIVIPTGKLVTTTIEVAGLQGAKTADLLENVDVPEGDYTELRLFVEDLAQIVRTSTALPYDLEIPGGSSSGLKIKGDFMVTKGQPTELVVDFDLLRSIELNVGGLPTDPKYKMNPVLRLIKGGTFGHKRGMVDAALLTAPTCSDGDPDTFNAVYVFEGHDVKPDDISQKPGKNVNPITTSKIVWDNDKSSYIYEAAFLPAGKYTIALTCNADREDLVKNDNLKFFGTRNITIKVNDTLFL